MATEKKWDSRNINVQVSDTDDATTSGKWLFQFYTMLSGSGTDGTISGSWGTATSPWQVISASNGTTMATKWNDYTDASSSATSHMNPRSWVIFKNSTMGHPTGSLWFMLDNISAGANDLSIHMSFAHVDPTFGSDAVDQEPTFASTAYLTMAGTPGGTDIQTRPAYDASNPTYFHGTMNTTGSFIAITGQNQNNALYYNFPHATMIMQLETPRSSSVDPYPYLIKSTYKNTTNGPFSQIGMVGHTNYTHWDDPLGGHAMWWKTGDIGSANDGMTPTFMVPGSNVAVSYPNTVNFDAAKSQNLDYLDGTSPMMPTFIMTWLTNYYSVRGRIPDVLCGWGGQDTYGMDGMATPATGTPEYAFLGNYWLPFSGTLQPGQ